MDAKILITTKLPEGPKQHFLNLSDEVKIRDSDGVTPKEELLQQVVGCVGLVCSYKDVIDVDVLNAAGPKLKVICTISVGYDHIDVEECKKREISPCFVQKITMLQYSTGSTLEEDDWTSEIMQVI
ncbi:uncharacterized protein TRIADDRAFT_52750 [Trichoplax adhaerens]|uniref:D-isomer specific 2-hydroxyacid dehydrogenase catalytic domain-containing protein n=1 Tax=Trichoplax adhaerens TaxID=10228 RepID=B3RK83_TRIAD|nr:hypothetical protein TRIADDRAFT_52750 [Trichoplax adhaerens]EDV29155.1 hypothetical protein TRIADDRAFT_52750 [Trichoplax adhaerens]|eukprot:XP_002108357.1 hypothetical protein TRIADDRAFT_52750 [Trichoplax adhaerens]